MFQSTKTYGHDLGLSCCFRQWRANSHCKLLHGYSLAFKLVFEAAELDHNNWVADFGGLKAVKAMLQDTFDHTLAVSSDDPDLDHLLALGTKGLANVKVVASTGCEAFAKLAYEMIDGWMVESTNYKPRVHLVSVEVSEHGGNSAVYMQRRRAVEGYQPYQPPTAKELMSVAKGHP